MRVYVEITCTHRNADYTYRNWKTRLILTMHTIRQKTTTNVFGKHFFKKLLMSQIHFIINIKFIHHGEVLLSEGSTITIQSSN